MPQAPITADLHQPLDVLRTFPVQVSLYLVVIVDKLPQPYDLLVGEIAYLRLRVYPRAFTGLTGARPANAVNIG